MAYATLADLVAQFGDREVIALTDRNDDGVADPALVESALRRASDTIDAYISARYPLPLSVVSSQLVDLCCDIARYKLCGAEATETDSVRNRYRDALKDLAHIRDGKIDIGLTATGQTPPESSPVHIIGGGRQFDRTSLSDF